MKIFLGILGRQGLFLATSNDDSILGRIEFSDTDQNHLSAKMAGAFSELLKISNLDGKDIQKLFCLSGPASFTGLRMSAAFMQGLSIGLGASLFSVPTALLLKKKSVLPLRHVLSEKLCPHDYFKQGYEALILEPSKPEGPFEIQSSYQEDLDYIGFKDGINILEKAAILKAIKSRENSKNTFKINYGLQPKVGGVRLT